MSRMKLGVLLAAVAALIVTSIAVADQSKPRNRSAVTAHFTASGNVKTQSCSVTSTPTKAGATPTSIPAGTVTHASLSGTSTSSDSRLNGSVRVALTMGVSPNGVGVATGTFRVMGKIDAALLATVSDNRLDGFLHSKNGKRLFANFSATLSGSTLTGDLGTGSHLNSAVIGLGGCGG